MLWRQLFSLVWPDPCPGCSGEGGSSPTRPLCLGCWEGMRRYRGARCRICGRPFASGHGVQCGECIVKPPPVARIEYFGLYEGSLREAIRALKYRRGVHLAAPLAGLVADCIPAGAGEICPVPLHPRRLREREYNQSLLIAAELAAISGVPLVPDRLKRLRPTPPQVGLSRAERTRNLRGAMQARQDPSVRGQTVVLVDDVCTTGATVAEAARALKRAGAGQVVAVVLARDDRDGDAVAAQDHRVSKAGRETNPSQSMREC